MYTVKFGTNFTVYKGGGDSTHGLRLRLPVVIQVSRLLRDNDKKIKRMKIVQMLLSVGIVKWDIIAIILGSIFLLAFILGILSGLSYRKFCVLFNKQEWEKALSKGLILERKMINPMNRLMNNLLKYHIAMIYFITADIAKFESKMNEVTHKKLLAVKYYWIILSNFISGNIETARRQYSLFKEAPHDTYKKILSYEFYDKCLTGVFDYYDGNYIAAKKKLQDILPKINNPASRKFYEEVINNCRDVRAN